jgi:Kef-type K+ transport system membrane component KefB
MADRRTSRKLQGAYSAARRSVIHLLVTYPLLRQMGLARNRAVATVVGATAVTDTSALLVLSVISGTVKPGGAL